MRKKRGRRRRRRRRTDWFKAQARNERYKGVWVRSGLGGFKGCAQGGFVDSKQEEEQGAPAR
jgi:hypothetical protein